MNLYFPMMMMMDWTAWAGISSYHVFSGNWTVARNASLVWLQLALSYCGLGGEECTRDEGGGYLGMRKLEDIIYDDGYDYDYGFFSLACALMLDD